MDSQCERIIKYLKTHKKGITTMDAFNKMGVCRLASRICDLRQKGYDIKTTHETGKNRYGDKVTYARYTLQ